MQIAVSVMRGRRLSLVSDNEKVQKIQRKTKKVKKNFLYRLTKKEERGILGEQALRNLAA